MGRGQGKLPLPILLSNHASSFSTQNLLSDCSFSRTQFSCHSFSGEGKGVAESLRKVKGGFLTFVYEGGRGGSKIGQIEFT